MPPGERTRKTSRKRLIIRSKAEIDYDRLHTERLAVDVADRQLEGWKTHESIRGIYPRGYDGAIVPWKTYSAAATMRHDVRVLLWFAGLSIIIVSVIIVMGVLFFS